MFRRAALVVVFSSLSACLGEGEEGGEPTDTDFVNGDTDTGYSDTDEYSDTDCLQSGIAGETEADRCAELFLAALTCLGDPDGLTFTWSVTSAEDPDTTDIVAPANQDGSMLTIPAQALEAGAQYAFAVDVSAPDGRAEHFEHAVTVAPRGAFQVGITGGPTVNHVRSHPLTLSSETSGGECDVAPTYRWEQLGPAFVDFSGVTTSTASISLGAYATQANATYGFQVTSTAGETESSASVTVNVAQQPLDVQISGGDRTVGLGSVLVLDAGASRDPDVQTGGADGFTYQWVVRNSEGVDTGVVLPSTPIVEFDPTSDGQLLDAGGIGPGAAVGFLDFSVTITGNGKVGTASARAHFVCDLNATPVTIGSIPSVTNVGGSGSTFVDLAATFQDMMRVVTLAAWHSVEWRETEQNLDLSTRVLSGGLTEPNVRVSLSGVPEGNYVFEVDATLCGSTENDSVTTLANRGPTGGAVTVSTSSATDADDITFTASGWSDSDTPLTYQFSVVSGGQTTVLNASAQSSSQLVARIAQPGTYSPRVVVTDSIGGSTTFTSSSTLTVTSSVPPGVDANNLISKTTGYSTELLDFTGASFNTLFDTGYAGTASAATTVTLYTNPTVDQYRTVVLLADMDAGGAVGSIGVDYGAQPTTAQGCFPHIRSGGKYGIIMRVQQGKSLVMRRYASSVGGLSGTFEMIVLYGNSEKYFLSTSAEPMKVYRNDSSGTCLSSWPIHFGWATPAPPSSPNPNPMEWHVETCPPLGDTTPCTLETYKVASSSLYPNRNVPKDWSVTIRTVNTDGASHVAEFTTAFSETTGYRFVELRPPASN